jgi:hypothetical protein
LNSVVIGDVLGLGDSPIHKPGKESAMAIRKTGTQPTQLPGGYVLVTQSQFKQLQSAHSLLHNIFGSKGGRPRSAMATSRIGTASRRSAAAPMNGRKRRKRRTSKGA